MLATLERVVGDADGAQLYARGAVIFAAFAPRRDRS